LALLRRSWNEKTKKHFTEIRIDDVRQILDLFKQASGEGGWRVAIVDSAEDLNASSANALLKMIEEPPPRSLFLILAHKPGQVLPTIRSRCRRLSLEVLTAPEVAAAVTGLGDDFAALGKPQIAEAAAKSGGSVREALRLLDGDGLALTKRLDGLFTRLPDVDWRLVHSLADQVSGREKTSEFEALVNGVYEFLDASVHTGAPPARLAPFAEVWEKMAAAVRETEALNLDRRPLILSIFADLSSAARAAKA
jgi:DNA polymerase-3 subunit delta'